MKHFAILLALALGGCAGCGILQVCSQPPPGTSGDSDFPTLKFSPASASSNPASVIVENISYANQAVAAAWHTGHDRRFHDKAYSLPRGTSISIPYDPFKKHRVRSLWVEMQGPTQMRCYAEARQAASGQIEMKFLYHGSETKCSIPPGSNILVYNLI